MALAESPAAGARAVQARSVPTDRVGSVESRPPTAGPWLYHLSSARRAAAGADLTVEEKRVLDDLLEQRVRDSGETSDDAARRIAAYLQTVADRKQPAPTSTNRYRPR